MSRVFFIISLFLLVGTLVGGCAHDAYQEACRSCPFDEKGNMDKACYDSYTQKGIGCITASYPIATAKHAKGECPKIDVCSQQLKSCTQSYAGFTDQEKCHSGMAICFRDADACVHDAALECGEKIDLSPCESAIILFSIGLMVFFIRFDPSF